MPEDLREPWSSLVTQVNERIDDWLKQISTTDSERAEQSNLLSTLREQPDNISFARDLLAMLANINDPFTSALELHRLSKQVPENLSQKERLTLKASGIAALGLPWAVIPLAKKLILNRINHLICFTELPSETTKPSSLNNLKNHLLNLENTESSAVLELYGQAINSSRDAGQERARINGLMKLPNVSHVLINPARIVFNAPYNLDAKTADLTNEFIALAEEAQKHNTQLSLAVNTYEDARIAVDVAIAAMEHKYLQHITFGVTVKAEIPESAEFLTKIAVAAAKRHANGGAPIEIRISTASSLLDATNKSIQTGLPVPVLESREAREANALKLLVSLNSQTGIIPVFVCDSPYLVAAALELAQNDTIIELRSGLAQHLTQVLIKDGITTRTTLPIVTPQEMNAVLTKLVDLTVEVTSESALHNNNVLDHEDLTSEPARLAEQNHLQKVVACADTVDEISRRTQNRNLEGEPSERDSALFYKPSDTANEFNTSGLTAAVLRLQKNLETGEIELLEESSAISIPAVSPSGFSNEPITDFTQPENRSWYKKQLEIASEIRAEEQAEEAFDPNNTGDLTVLLNSDVADVIGDNLLKIAAELRKNGKQWASGTAELHGRVLRRIAYSISVGRDRFAQGFMAALGESVTTVDAHINTLIDSARYAALLNEKRHQVRGATFVPDKLTLIVAVNTVSTVDAIRAALTALGSGSAVLMLGPAQIRPLLTVVLQEWTAAGLPENLLSFASTPDIENSAKKIVQHAKCDRAIIFGDKYLADQLLATRPELKIENIFNGIGTVLITPTCDTEQAIKDIIASAYTGHDVYSRGIKALILQGSLAKSENFRTQLANAVRGINTGDSVTNSFAVQLSPLPEVPNPAQLAALTELNEGESWLIEPAKLDGEGLLWSPGIRLGVKTDSPFWQQAHGVPVIGVITANTLHDAINLQNLIGDGSIAGLQSWDAKEITIWLDNTISASLSVNRPTTGAMIERHPSGNWGSSGMNSLTLTGGPHELVSRGTWVLREGSQSSTLHLRGLEPDLQMLIELAQQSLNYEEFDRVRRAALADALTWRTQLRTAEDQTSLRIELNLLRYWPARVFIRASETAGIDELLRVILAALLVRSSISISSGIGIPQPLLVELQNRGIEILLEDDQQWHGRLAEESPLVNGLPAERIRLIGADRTKVADILGGSKEITIISEPVTMAGPVELLTMLKEQAISIRTERFGLVSISETMQQWLAEIAR